jgi:hypothetical protein
MAPLTVEEVAVFRDELISAIGEVARARDDVVATMRAVERLKREADNFELVALLAIHQRIASRSHVVIAELVKGLPRMRAEWPVDDFDADVWYWVGFCDGTRAEGWAELLVRKQLSTSHGMVGELTALSVCGDTEWAYQLGVRHGSQPPAEALTSWSIEDPETGAFG